MKHFIINIMLIALANANAHDTKYTHRLKAGAGSGSLTTSSGSGSVINVDIESAAIERSNSNEASNSTPWEFELYALDDNSAHWPTGKKPSNIGTWTSTEKDLIENAAHFWNNSGARVKINFHKGTPQNWKTNYGWALGGGYPYTILKVTGELLTEDGATSVFGANSTGTNGQNWQWVGRAAGITGTADLSELSFNFGTQDLGVYIGCDVRFNQANQTFADPTCFKRKSGCTDDRTGWPGVPTDACSELPVNYGSHYRDFTCPYTKDDPQYFDCFVKICTDQIQITPTKSVLDYTRCLEPASNVMNLHGATLVMNFQSTQLTTHGWAYDPTNLDEAGSSYEPSTSTYDHTNMNTVSFTKTVIHEMGHYIGLIDHDTRTYNVDENKVGSEFISYSNQSYKDWLLESFTAQPTSGPAPQWHNNLSYANLGLNSLPVQYVDASDDVYDLTQSGTSWSWVLNSSASASTIRNNAWARAESFMTTKQLTESPTDLKTRSYLGFGRECMLTTTGCSGITNIYDQIVDYRRLYDLYNANPKTEEMQEAE